MSYIFDVGDLTVWSPALRVGRLFVQLCDCLASAVGADSGLSKMADDYYVIHPEIFGTFLQSLVRGPSSHHAIFAELTRGFVATSLVLLERAGEPMPMLDESQQDWIQLKDALSQSMPTL